MKLEGESSLFIIVALVGLLLISSPILSEFINIPRSDPFSELYILGNNRMLQDYPFNIVPGENYSLYVGVTNNLYSSAYYKIYVKLCSETDQLPNMETGSPSPLPKLFSYRLLLRSGEASENTLTFSIPYIDFLSNQCTVNDIVLNGLTYEVDKSTKWSINSTGFYFQLFFELWLYDVETSNFKFNNRSVGIWLNMTQGTSEFLS